VNLLKTAREKCGLSQRKLAGLAGVPQATISRLEIKNIRPSPEVAASLVPFLNGYVTELHLLYPERFSRSVPKKAKKAA
jgi:transcriptional regulator with XRE-family HTH domain